MGKDFILSKDLSEICRNPAYLPCIMTAESGRRRRMNAMTRREQIIERMKIRKSDTAHNLAFEFGVSWRTVINDVMELTVNGYPIQAEPGNGGGIRWFGGKRQYPYSDKTLRAINNAIALASPEDKPELENLICTNEKPKIDKNDIFGLLTGGTTQRALAAELGISESYLSRILSGQKKPGSELAGKITRLKNGVIGV